MEKFFKKIYFSRAILREITNELNSLYDDVLQNENTTKSVDKKQIANEFKERMLQIIKMFCFIMTESGTEYSPDKFEIQFFYIRDEIIESIDGSVKYIEIFSQMLTNKGVSEQNEVVLYLLKKTHLYRKKVKKELNK